MTIGAFDTPLETYAEAQPKPVMMSWQPLKLADRDTPKLVKHRRAVDAGAFIAVRHMDDGWVNASTLHFSYQKPIDVENFVFLCLEPIEPMPVPDVLGMPDPTGITEYVGDEKPGTITRITSPFDYHPHHGGVDGD